MNADDTPFQRRLLREIEAAKVKATAKARRQETHRIRGQTAHMIEQIRLMNEQVRDLEVAINRVGREKKARRELIGLLLDAMEKLMLYPNEPEVVAEARAVYRKFRP